MNLSPTRVAAAPGQESVWDYPRPPRLEKVQDHVRVVFAGETIAETDHAFRVLETSHPPVYYLPPDHVRMDFLVAAGGRSFCEFKGTAKYWSLDVGTKRSEQAAWSYPDPISAFAELRDHLAFYASRVDECWIGNERVQPQPGDFYGGWITSRVVGPFKGSDGTLEW